MLTPIGVVAPRSKRHDDKTVVIARPWLVGGEREIRSHSSLGS